MCQRPDQSDIFINYENLRPLFPQPRNDNYIYLGFRFQIFICRTTDWPIHRWMQAASSESFNSPLSVASTPPCMQDGVWREMISFAEEIPWQGARMLICFGTTKNVIKRREIERKVRRMLPAIFIQLDSFVSARLEHTASTRLDSPSASGLILSRAVLI